MSCNSLPSGAVVGNSDTCSSHLCIRCTFPPLRKSRTRVYPILSGNHPQGILASTAPSIVLVSSFRHVLEQKCCGKHTNRAGPGGRGNERTKPRVPARSDSSSPVPPDPQRHRSAPTQPLQGNTSTREVGPSTRSLSALRTESRVHPASSSAPRHGR